MFSIKNYLEIISGELVFAINADKSFSASFTPCTLVTEEYLSNKMNSGARIS
jgi:hypothetical protein